MERRSAEDMIRLRAELVKRSITPAISKEEVIPPAPVMDPQPVLCVVLRVTFYDNYSGTAEKTLEFACPVADFYTLRDKEQAELTTINQVITWIETN